MDDDVDKCKGIERELELAQVVRFHIEVDPANPLCAGVVGLSGQLSFVGSTGHVRAIWDEIQSDEASLDGIGANVVSKYRDVWLNDSDDDILAMVAKRAPAYLLTVTVGDQFKVKEDKTRAEFMVEAMLLLYTTHDMLGEILREWNSKDEFNLPLLLQHWRTSTTTDFDLEAVPRDTTNLDIVRRVFQAIVDQLDEGLPDWKKTSYWMRDEILSMIEGKFLLYRKNGQDGGKWSEESQVLFRRGLHRHVINVVAMFHGIRIPAGIRNDNVFQLSLSLAADICVQLDAIFELPLDLLLRPRAEIDSPIMAAVVIGGVPLQEAFDGTIRRLRSLYSDYAMASQKLMEFYHTETQVKKHVECLDWFIDSRLFAYHKGMQQNGIRSELAD